MRFGAIGAGRGNTALKKYDKSHRVLGVFANGLRAGRKYALHLSFFVIGCIIECCAFFKPVLSRKFFDRLAISHYSRCE